MNILQIIQDQNPPSPREYDNLFTIAYVDRRYLLGDVQVSDMDEHRRYLLVDVVDFPDELSDDEVDDLLDENYYIFPAYLAGHPESRDSIMYMEEAEARINWPDRTADEREERARRVAQAELAEFAAYLAGDTYGYRLLDPDGDELDSCWGFIGDDWKTNGIADHIPAEYFPLEVQRMEYEYRQVPVVMEADVCHERP